MAMLGGRYNYTVPSLLHEAGRHRRSEHCGGGREDDHVIELRLVVAALKQLPYGTYSHPNWQKTLVDFFNAKHRNHECLGHNRHQQKTHAVDKWIQHEHLSDSEMTWINEIRDIWKQSRNQLRGFDQFKQALNSILRMS